MVDQIHPLGDMPRRFAEEYLIDFKAGPAALRAGYAAMNEGYLLLTDPRIQALIKDGKRKISERVNISIDNTLEMLRRIAHGDITPVLRTLADDGKGSTFIERFEALPDEVRACVKSIKWTKNGPEIILHDKIAALTLIGKYQGIFTDKSETKLVGPNGGPVQVETINPEMDAKTAAEMYAATIGEGGK